MNKKAKILTVLMLLLATFSFGQTSSEAKEGDINYKHSLGSSLFSLVNLTDDSPDYYLLTYGYRLTKEDRIFVEFNTWKYSQPLGTISFRPSDDSYPGFVRSWGIGAGYQCFIWKGLFTTIQATGFIKQYFDEKNEKMQKGFQLYLQTALGYRINLFKDRWYIEPAIALKYWPINTNIPEDFAKVEEGTSLHIFEPSLNFGFRF